MTTTAQPARCTVGPPGPTVPLSVLDRGGHAPGTSGERAVLDLVDAARTAEACGYHRFWVAEHHASAGTASSCPPVLIAHLAARTERLRIGAGGVMLPNHAPLTVAEQFATLQALHPGRIDLGLGRPPGAVTAEHRLLAAALRRDPRAIGEFPSQLDELLGFLHHRGPERHRFHALRLAPDTATPPQVHLLGASGGSARIAAERGLPFAYGHHLSRSVARPEAAVRYRSAFVPGPEDARPHLIVAVNVVCAETDEEAESLALRTAADRAAAGGGNPPAPLSPVRADYLARRELTEYQVVHGSPAVVAARLDALAAELGADEIMLAPYELTGPARCRTLRLAAGVRRPRARLLGTASRS